jgi:hypothetical protein
VSVRKEFPHSVSLRIHESTPFAILEMKGRSFLIDEKGKMLEEMKGAIPFLPIITADPFGERENFMEASTSQGAEGQEDCDREGARRDRGRQRP